MTQAIAHAVSEDLKPLIEQLLSQYSSSIVEDIRTQHKEMSVEIRAVSDHLEKALSKIDIMIARSDARVEAINHMVDNCLELSRTCSAATEEANRTVSTNCNAIHEDIILHRQLAEDHSSNVAELHAHIRSLEGLLHAERQERSSLHEAVTSIKQTIDVLIGSAARPNVNINQHKQ